MPHSVRERLHHGLHVVTKWSGDDHHSYTSLCLPKPSMHPVPVRNLLVPISKPLVSAISFAFESHAGALIPRV